MSWQVPRCRSSVTVAADGQRRSIGIVLPRSGRARRITSGGSPRPLMNPHEHDRANAANADAYANADADTVRLVRLVYLFACICAMPIASRVRARNYVVRDARHSHDRTTGSHDIHDKHDGHVCNSDDGAVAVIAACSRVRRNTRASKPSAQPGRSVLFFSLI